MTLGLSLGLGLNRNDVFVPTQIAGLLQWWDASDLSTITHAAGAVSQWNSKVGSNHATQATGAYQPLTGTRTINGRNALECDGSTLMSFTPTAFNGASGFTAFVAAIPDAISGSDGTLFQLDGDSLFALRTQLASSGAVYSVGKMDTADGNKFNTGTYVLPVGVPFIDCSSYLANGSARHNYTGQAQLNNSGLSNNTVNVTGGFLLGLTAGSQSYRGAVGEILMYNSELSVGDKRRVADYLAKKWGAVVPVFS